MSSFVIPRIPELNTYEGKLGADMRASRLLGVALACVSLICSVYAFQRPFREYPGWEYEEFPLPPDWQEKAEWVFARLMYPTYSQPFDRQFRGFTDWTKGRTNWTIYYPPSDRHLSEAVRRLTRIHARSVEQPVNLDDGDEVYNWPWLCAGEMGDWNLTASQASTLREYLLRGGFLMLDDFWGPEEYARFEESMKRVFPDRPVVDIDSKDSIFHTAYDLDDRYQIMGQWALDGKQSYRTAGTVA